MTTFKIYATGVIAAGLAGGELAHMLPFLLAAPLSFLLGWSVGDVLKRATR